jgi:hypothetical protein
VSLQYKYREIEKSQEKAPVPTSVQVDYKTSEKESFYLAQDERPSLPSESADASEMAPSKVDREDHRLSGYRSGSTSGTTSRLHGHIRKDNEGAPDVKVRSVESQSTYLDAKDSRTPPRKALRNQEISNEILVAEVAPPTPNVDELESVSLTSKHVLKKTDGTVCKSMQDNSSRLDTMKNQNEIERRNVVSQRALRKASDEFDFTGVTTKPSIEEMLDAPSRARMDIVYDSDGDKEHDRSLDLQSEKQYYAEAKVLRDNTELTEQKSATVRSRSNSYLEQHLIENEGKHTLLRQPLNSPPQFVQKSLSKVDQVREKLQSSISSQIPSDDNFVNEDWDNSPERGKKDSGLSLPIELDSRDVTSKNAKLLIPNSVRADDNWLDDDFDS